MTYVRSTTKNQTLILYFQTCKNQSEQRFYTVKSDNAFLRNRIPSPMKSVRNPGRIAIAVAIAKATAICTPLSSPNIQKQIVAPYTITPKNQPIPEITLPKNERMK